MELQHNIINDIRVLIANARKSIVKSVNSAMVFTYWEIGKRKVEEEQKGEEKAKYGSFLIKNSAQQLSTEFGKGFDERELRKMRQFYSCFPIRDALRPELSWTHYRLLLRVEDRNARSFYLSESIEGGWSSRQLDRQISSAYNNGSEQLFASQYQLYLPTETQLKEWVNKQRLFLDLKNNTDEHK